MADASTSLDAREQQIVVAAIGVFRRYGFKKTSMDDLARAAGLSRQGLYLRFPTKEALFKAVAEHVIAGTRSAGRAALEREDVSVEERLLGAFVAMYGHMVGSDGAETLDELMQTASRLVGPAVCEHEEGFVADVARVLRSAGVAAGWKQASVSAKELAEHLVATSTGLKQKGKRDADYRDGMRTAVRIVCRGRVSG
jgi:AcrR family transcriptional regulator